MAINTSNVGHDEQIVASIPLIPNGEDRIGWMRADIWEGMYDILTEQSPLDEENDVQEAYTTEFLEHVYGEEP